MKRNAFVNGYLEGYMAKQAVQSYPKAIAGDPGTSISAEDMAKAKAYKDQEDAKKRQTATTPAPAGTAAANTINQAAADRKAALAL
jgi:hypothetical protein